MPKRLIAPALAALVLAGASWAVSAGGTIHTVAGTGAAGFSGDGGKATAARLNAPAGVAVDRAGNLYVADTANHRVRKVTPAGAITTAAGTGVGGFAGDGGPAAAAQLFSPRAVAVDAAGNVYVADTGNNRIRRISPEGTISTIAGTGEAGYTPDGAAAAEAALYEPKALAVDPGGNLFVAEGSAVRRISPAGTLSTVAGQQYDGFNGDGILGPAAQLYAPAGVAVDAAGNVYVADSGNNRVRRVGTNGIITTVAGTGSYELGGDGGPATAAGINVPSGLAVDAEGSVYVADRYSGRVRKIVPGGIILTVAGGGRGRGEFVAATSASLSEPVGLALGPDGSLYVADPPANRVRRVADLGPQLGTVGRAWVSATKSGPPARRLPENAREFWAHFLFAEQPAAGLPIRVELYGPRTKVAVIEKERAKRLDVVLRLRRNAVFVPGRWRVVLVVAGKPVRAVVFRVEAFSVQ